MLRALSETVVEGVATTVPAHVAILGHPDFAAAAHSTKWVEERLDLSEVRSEPAADAPAPDDSPRVLREVDAEVDGRRYRVRLWVPDGAAGGTGGVAGDAQGTLMGGSSRRPAAARGRGGGTMTAAGSGTVTVPMQGTIVKVLVAVGDTVVAGQTICVLEAMKMENPITADREGTVEELRVQPGDALGAGDVVAVIR
jgi:acetyl-CoA/propionyl-CoA carboxylase biotin carboxyl carrier protein